MTAPAYSPVPPLFLGESQWVAWTPNAGPLVVSFADGSAIGSIWLPVVPTTITFAFSPEPTYGSATYVSNSSGIDVGPELVPVPTVTTQVTMTASGATPIYVWFSNTAFNPFKGAAVLSSTVRLKMCSANFTPVVGADLGSYSLVPWKPGTPEGVLTPVTWEVTDISVRVEQPGAATASLIVEGFTGGGLPGAGAWVTSYQVNPTPVTIAAGSYTPTVRPPVIANPNVASGDMLRINYGAVSSDMNFTVYVVLTLPAGS